MVSLNPDSARVLRPEMSNAARLRKVLVQIHVNRDLRTARYNYEFAIDPNEAFDDVWREVFAYPVSEVRHVSVKAGDKQGPRWELSSLNTPDQHACLTIQLDGLREFGFELETRIESTGAFSMFGGQGCVAYWTSFEHACDLLDVQFFLPPGVSVASVSPASASVPRESPIRFVRRSSGPMEFFLAFGVLERRPMGISPRQARVLDKLFWTVLGTGLAAGLSTFLGN